MKVFSCMSVRFEWLVAFVLFNLIVCDAQFCSPLQSVSAASSGEIVSHSGFGVTNYSNNQRCIWQITAPAGSRLVAWFTYIDVEVSYDFVKFLDGLSTNNSADNLINMISTAALPTNTSPRMISISNSMTVIFYADISITGKGFRLQYSVISAINSPSCGPISYDSSSRMSGFITSHAAFGTQPYPLNMSCSWNLPKKAGNTTRLTVTDMSLGDGDCVRLPTNSLLTSLWNLSNTYCGPVSLRTTVSIDSDEASNIVFFSNSLNQSSGFFIRFEYQKLLGSVQTATIVRSVIYNHVSHTAVQAAPYSNNMRDYWQVTAPVDTRIEAWFTYINLQYPNDAIALYSFINSSLALMVNMDATAAARYSQSTHYISSTNILRTAFRTDSSGTALGFRMQLMVTEAYCGGLRSVNAVGGGEIVSHTAAGTNNYLNGMNCRWQITAPTGYAIVVQFTYYNLETCCDRVVLHNGNFSGPIIIDTFGATSLTFQKFQSTSNAMAVYFSTDDSVIRLGFRLRYDAMKLGSETDSPGADVSYSSSWIGTGIGITAAGVIICIICIVTVVVIRMRQAKAIARAQRTMNSVNMATIPIPTPPQPQPDHLPPKYYPTEDSPPPYPGPPLPLQNPAYYPTQLQPMTHGNGEDQERSGAY